MKCFIDVKNIVIVKMKILHLLLKRYILSKFGNINSTILEIPITYIIKIILF